jgi:hypothetical protein
MHRARWLLPAAGAGLTCYLLARTDLAWGWTGLLWSVLLAALASLHGRTGPRLLLAYASCVPLALGGLELWLGLRQRPIARPPVPASTRIVDDDVGVRPAPGARWREAIWLGDELVYDVGYTMDGQGERVTPAARGGDDALCVVFFGCSFAFGTGVEDGDTLPWLTSVATGHLHRVHNFSFAGWGPHQMLAALQSGRIERALDCTPTHAVYESLYDHVARVAGHGRWDPHGPRFVLGADGRVVRAGNFDDRPTFLRAWPRLGKSQILSALSERFEPAQGDFDLFAEVVEASRDRLVARYPHLDFHVLLWDKRWKQDPEYWNGLLRRGLQVHFVSEILPGLRDAPERYVVSPEDGHPNRVANERLAAFVAREILGQPTAGAVLETASAPSRAGAP